MEAVRLNALFISLLLVAAAGARPWTDDVIYFAMTDRFCDGDPANNVPEGSDPALYDARQQDLARYLGGDLRGLENALQAGYFNDLGVTALWLTPVVRNVWRSGYDLGGWKSGYHGYWAQDWLDIDPHLTSKMSLAGKPYADTAEGRMEHYRDFVKLARSKGIKVIQDVVMNHAGPVFYYDANGDGAFNSDKKDEWVQPFKKDGYHANAKWADVAKWNVKRTQPDGPRELLGVKIATKGTLSQMDSYGRKGFSSESLGKSDGEEVECDFFSLRDLWTKPDGGHFDELVDEFVEIYHFYLSAVGVDGLRIDTVKHVHHGFWDAFTERLRKRLGNAAADKILFGEIYDGNPVRLGQYTWRSDWPQRTEPALDSVLDFNFCFNAREYLRQPGGRFGSPAALEKALQTRSASDRKQRPLYNPNPGADGLNARQKMITFIENHDGLNRFRVAGITVERNRLAQALMLTLPGIPCLYYGTEFDLIDNDAKPGDDSETGRMMFYQKQGGPSMKEVASSAAFSGISKLAALRAKHPVLRTGSVIPLWVDGAAGSEDDGVFAFARASEDGESFAVVVVNASNDDRVTAAGGHQLKLPSSLKTSGKVLRHVLTSTARQETQQAGFDATGPLRLPVPASSLVIYLASSAD
jgi:glycosidase